MSSGLAITINRKELTFPITKDIELREHFDPLTKFQGIQHVLVVVLKKNNNVKGYYQPLVNFYMSNTSNDSKFVTDVKACLTKRFKDNQYVHVVDVYLMETKRQT